jgi:hypothetical protein
MLLEAGDSSVPLIGTTLAHAQAAVKRALQESAARGPSDVSGNGWRAGLVSRRGCAPARARGDRKPRGKGVAAEQPAEPGPRIRTSWLTGPHGYRIELVQWPPGHAAGMTAADFAL